MAADAEEIALLQIRYNELSAEHRSAFIAGAISSLSEAVQGLYRGASEGDSEAVQGLRLSNTVIGLMGRQLSDVLLGSARMVPDERLMGLIFEVAPVLDRELTWAMNQTFARIRAA